MQFIDHIEFVGISTLSAKPVSPPSPAPDRARPTNPTTWRRRTGPPKDGVKPEATVTLSLGREPGAQWKVFYLLTLYTYIQARDWKHGPDPPQREPAPEPQRGGGCVPWRGQTGERFLWFCGFCTFLVVVASCSPLRAGGRHHPHVTPPSAIPYYHSHPTSS